MTGMDNVQEKMPDWLIMDYMPRYQITSLAGDGGSGKTTVWCAITAAVSSGRKAFLESFLPEEWSNSQIMALKSIKGSPKIGGSPSRSDNIVRP